MAADKVPPGRAFITAAQSLQHLATNAQLADAGHGASASGEASTTSTKVYQQTPNDVGDDDSTDGGEPAASRPRQPTFRRV